MRMIDSNRISAWPHLPHVSTVRGLHANGNWVGGFAGQRGVVLHVLHRLRTGPAVLVGFASNRSRCSP